MRLFDKLRAGEEPGLSGNGTDHPGWFFAEFLPGSHPLEEPEVALLRIAVNPPERLLGQLREDARGLPRAVKRVLPADPAVELVLLIDQLEVLFTLVDDEAARAHVLASLVAAVDEPRSRLRLIITLRADRYDRPLLYPGLADLLRAHTELALPLPPPELRRWSNRALTAVARSMSRSWCRASRPKRASQRRARPAAGWCVTSSHRRGGRWPTQRATRPTSPPRWTATERPYGRGKPERRLRGSTWPMFSVTYGGRAGRMASAR